MNNKQKLLKEIKEEFNKNYKDLEFSYEDQRTYHIMSLIIDHIIKILIAHTKLFI